MRSFAAIFFLQALVTLFSFNLALAAPRPKNSNILGFSVQASHIPPRGISNHWRIYAITGIEESVCFDMSYDGSPHRDSGKLSVTECKYFVATSTVLDVPIYLGSRPAGTPKVLENYLRGRGFGDYHFTEDHNKNALGCRHWVLSVISNLEQCGIVAPGSTNHLCGIIDTHIELDGTRCQRAVECGRFVRPGH